ncbi:hypothetical protein K1W54_41465 [Micromonospora sp. CPCC 205371]|nr:hypothetical protein [Micromonospora sp. CPCC 205371]
MVIRGLLPVMLATLLAACGGGSTDGSADPTAEPTAGTPSAEASATEEPAPNGGGDPAIETVGLPIGGVNEFTQETECAFVAYSDAIPDGIEMTGAEVFVDGGKRASLDCGTDSCDGYTFSAARKLCAIGLTVKSGTSATLSIKGRVSCSLPAAECASFLERLTGQSIQVFGPPASPSPSESPYVSPSAHPSETASGGGDGDGNGEQPSPSG